MRIIRQIVVHLARQDMLSREERSWLVREGYASWYDVFPEDEARDLAAIAARSTRPGEMAAEPAGQADWQDDTLVGRPSRPRAAGRSARRPGTHEITETALIEKLRSDQESWASQLGGLVALAAEFSTGPLAMGDQRGGNARRVDPADWRHAATRLRQTPIERIEAAVETVIETRRVDFERLWQAVSCEPYVEVLPADAFFGKAARAYWAVIESVNQPHLGRHAPLLRHPEVAAVANLRAAQRRTLAAFAPLLGRRRDLLDRVITLRSGADSYWTFVIAYSANRGVRGNRPAGGALEAAPAREPPPERAWQHAWEGATILDPRAVGPFLLDYLDGFAGFAGVAGRRNAAIPFRGERLFCPAAWNRRYEREPTTSSGQKTGQEPSQEPNQETG